MPLASVAKRLALVGLSLAFTGAGLEVALRLFWDGYYLKERKSYAMPHPDRGWENRPGIEVDVGQPEFSTRATHNSLGLRGPEIAEAPGDRLRVVVLGDSFTYGVGVEDDETFSARLAELDPHLEVLNLGVNNYSTTQELLLLRERGLAFEPRVVVLAFFWNDVPDSFKREFPAFRLDEGVLRYPEPRSPADPPLMSWEASRKPLRHSYAYRFLSDRLDLLRWRVSLALGRPIDDPYVLREDEVEPAWSLIRAVLLEMDRLAREAGSVLLVALIPDQTLVAPFAALGLLGFSESDVRIHERMAALGAETGIRVVDLLPALRAAGETGGAPLYYPIDRHLTARGHEVVAERLAEEIGSLEGLR
jgi:lysophospholipase L1-like esterase